MKNIMYIFFLLIKIVSTYIPKKFPSLKISLQKIKYTNFIKIIINEIFYSLYLKIKFTNIPNHNRKKCQNVKMSKFCSTILPKYVIF